MNCAHCNTSFQVTDADRSFYEKIDVPEPTLCSGCRLRRKLAYRNERNLYQRQCGLTGQKIITMFHPDTPYIPYAPDAWWGDDWNAMAHGRDYDFSRPFFEQWNELFKAVPKCNLSNFDHENSEYCNYSCHNKNCYLLFGSWFNETCLYGNTVLNSNNVLDSLFADRCEYGYQLVDCNKSYELFYSQLCDQCSSSWFLYNCRSCSNCIACTNLNEKENYIFNEPVSKEEVDEMKKKINAQTLAEWQNKFEELKKTAVRKFMTGVNNQNVKGDFIYNSKNITNSYVIYESEDIAYGFRVSKKQKDSYDITGCSGGELIYDSIHNDFSNHSSFVMSGEYNADSYYCSNSYHIDHCFGCDGLKHKKYCILNKQYTKEEYESLVPKIIEQMKSAKEWGEFFPVKYSPFAYNETVAQDYFPLKKEEVLSRNWRWRETLGEVPKADRTIPASRLPDSINDVPDDILNWAIECEKTGRPFKIIPQELKFYRQFSIPIPHFHPDERHLSRMALRNPMKLYDRKCEHCQKAIETTYAPGRLETVYCENCYLKEVY